MPIFGSTTFPLIRVRSGPGAYILLPVLTTTQRNSLSAETGKLIYNSTNGQIENYDGSNWVAVGKVYGDATFLPLAGGTMVGNIAFSGAQTVDGIDVSAHAANHAAHMIGLFNTALIGQYEWHPTGPAASGTLAVTAGVFYAVPHIVARTKTYDRIAAVVTSAGAAGKLVRLGIYLDGGLMTPAGAALVLDAGTIPADGATGFKTITISQQLAIGCYWLVAVSDGTPTMKTCSMQMGGLGAPAATDGTANRGYIVASSYGALPSTFPASPTLTTDQTAVVYVGLRVLSNN